MSVLRKIANEREARVCLDAVKRSGGTLRTWAHANGVDGRSLRAWQNILSQASKRSRSATEEARLVEIIAAPERRKHQYVVRVGGCEIEVADDFDATSLARLVAVLRSC